MVIRLISKDYVCKSDIGIFYYDHYNLLDNINSIIEWKESGFPFKLKEGGSPMNKEDYIEDRNFLGPNPILTPGCIFVWRGQKFAIDSPTRLILLGTETGFNSSQRFYEEYVQSELDLIKDYNVNSVKVEKVDKIEEGYDQRYTPKYALMDIWKTKFMSGRYEDQDILKIMIDSDDYIINPVIIYVSGWHVYYNSFIFEDQIEYVVNQSLGYLYKTEPRLHIVKKEK